MVLELVAQAASRNSHKAPYAAGDDLIQIFNLPLQYYAVVKGKAKNHISVPKEVGLGLSGDTRLFKGPAWKLESAVSAQPSQAEQLGEPALGRIKRAFQLRPGAYQLPEDLKGVDVTEVFLQNAGGQPVPGLKRRNTSVEPGSVDADTISSATHATHESKRQRIG